MQTPLEFIHEWKNKVRMASLEDADAMSAELNRLMQGCHEKLSPREAIISYIYQEISRQELRKCVTPLFEGMRRKTIKARTLRLSELLGAVRNDMRSKT